jgi:hypothetical protein
MATRTRKLPTHTLRLAVVLALAAVPACKRPDPGTKNKPARIEAGLGTGPLGAALSTDETSDAPKAPAEPTLQTTNQVSEVQVRGWDPQDKKEVVGKATSTSRKKP